MPCSFKLETKDALVAALRAELAVVKEAKTTAEQQAAELRDRSVAKLDELRCAGVRARPHPRSRGLGVHRATSAAHEATVCALRAGAFASANNVILLSDSRLFSVAQRLSTQLQPWRSCVPTPLGCARRPPGAR